jgi:hypothetical protein
MRLSSHKSIAHTLMVTVWFGVGQFFPGDFGSIISRR